MRPAPGGRGRHGEEDAARPFARRCAGVVGGGGAWWVDGDAGAAQCLGVFARGTVIHYSGVSIIASFLSNNPQTYASSPDHPIPS